MKYWSANTVSQLGTQLTTLAFPLTAAVLLHASPSQMGLLAASETAPAFLFGLFIGVWVDRIRRIPLMVAAHLVRCILLLLVPILWIAGKLVIADLYIVAFLVGIFSIAFQVAYSSHLPSIVDRRLLISANSGLQTTDSVAQVVGPAVAGWLIALMTAPIAILIDSVSYVFAALVLWRVKSTDSSRSSNQPRRRVHQQIGERLSAFMDHPALRAITVTRSIQNLFGTMFFSMLVLYLTRRLGLESSQVGLVFAAGGLGAIIGSISVPHLSARFGTGVVYVSAQLLMGFGGLLVFVSGYANAAALPIAMTGEFVWWFMLVIGGITQVSVRQATTPDRLLGRVSGRYQGAYRWSQHSRRAPWRCIGRNDWCKRNIDSRAAWN